MVEPQFREPFIVKGYRQPNMAALDCLKSPFVYYCNETINVWSHFLGFLIFLIKFYMIFTKEFNVENIHVWPLMSYALGIMGFCLMSSIAHTFNSISPTVRNICFFLDYAAIGIYSVGAGQAFYFYCRPLGHDIYIYQSPFMFSLFSIFISITSTVMCCLTRHNWHSLKYILRTCSMILPFLVNASPYLYRLLFCRTDLDCDYRSFSLFAKHCVLYALAAVANVTRLPERFIPGVFDTLGQSHHLMHIFTAVGAGIQFEAIKMDMVNRMDVLQDIRNQAEASNTFTVMLAALVVNFAIAILFGVTSTRGSYDKIKKSS